MKITVSYDVTPCSLEVTEVAEEGTALIFWEPWFLKVEAMCSSEKSAMVFRSTWRHIPEDSNLYTHRPKNLKSLI
jgi:hypothetical protein